MYTIRYETQTSHNITLCDKSCDLLSETREFKSTIKNINCQNEEIYKDRNFLYNPLHILLM